MWRLLLCLVTRIQSQEDAVVVDSTGAFESPSPQQLMSAEELRKIHAAMDKNKDGKAGRRLR